MILAGEVGLLVARESLLFSEGESLCNVCVRGCIYVELFPR